MQKRSEVCKVCQHAAVCYGLGMQVVLQSVADTSVSWDGAAINADAWASNFEKDSWELLRDALPDACPEYKPEDWYICFNRDGGINVVTASQMKGVTKGGGYAFGV